MIDVSAAARAVLLRSRHYEFTVESWRNGVLLDESVPAVTGVEDGERSSNVPEHVTFAVPRRDRGVSWAPSADDHPLASNGQHLHVKIGIGVAGGVEVFQRGVFLIHSSRVEGDAVIVQTVGKLDLIREAQLVAPFQPTGTMASTLRQLVEPALTVAIDATLIDRAVPAGTNWDQDRLGAVAELLDSWAAEGVVDTAGILQVRPADRPLVSVRTLTDGVGDVVIDAAGESTREGAFDMVVARGIAADGGQVQGIAYDLSGGPKSFEGPWNPLPVPYHFFSPLLTTAAECTAAAVTVKERNRRRTARAFTVTMPPDPTLQLGDVCLASTEAFSGLCTIERMNLPYHPDGGAQRLTLRAVA
jgi:hypothetical protein